MSYLIFIILFKQFKNKINIQTSNKSIILSIIILIILYPITFITLLIPTNIYRIILIFKYLTSKSTCYININHNNIGCKIASTQIKNLFKKKKNIIKSFSISIILGSLSITSINILLIKILSSTIDKSIFLIKYNNKNKIKIFKNTFISEINKFITNLNKEYNNTHIFGMINPEASYIIKIFKDTISEIEAKDYKPYYELSIRTTKISSIRDLPTQVTHKAITDNISTKSHSVVNVLTHNPIFKNLAGFTLGNTINNKTITTNLNTECPKQYTKTQSILLNNNNIEDAKQINLSEGADKYKFINTTEEQLREYLIKAKLFSFNQKKFILCDENKTNLISINNITKYLSNEDCILFFNRDKLLTKNDISLINFKLILIKNKNELNIKSTEQLQSLTSQGYNTIIKDSFCNDHLSSITLTNNISLLIY